MVAKDFVTKVLGIKDAQTITAMATTKEGNYERKKNSFKAMARKGAQMKLRRVFEDDA